MPNNFNLACAIHRHALATPEATAVVCQGRSLSYSELAEQAARLASCLRQSPDWPRQNGRIPRVGLLASRGVDACVALIGASWSGATYVPISMKQPEERILGLFEQCELSAIVTDDQGAKLLNERLLAACPPLVIHTGQMRLDAQANVNFSLKLLELSDLPPVRPEEPARLEATDTAYIIFTSGTTGVPKGVMISAGCARNYTTMIAEHLGLRADDRALETCELSFDFSVHNMFSTWQAGAALHILPATTVMNAVKFARNSGLTVWNSVPSLASMLRHVKALAPDSLASLRVTVFGGEQLPANTVTAWQSAAPNSRIFNLYGPTEATVFCTGHAVEEQLQLTPGRDVISIGTALPGNEAMIVDENDQPVTDGTSGELLIGGCQLADGYLGAPDLTARRFPTLNGKRWYRTGDLALRNAGGDYYCLGRIDNQVKVMGYRVELEEIDAHLRTVSGADVVGSIAWPVTDGGARGIVSFVHAASIDSEQIIDTLKSRIPSYMVPSRVIALKEMPLSNNGKVNRHALRQLLDEGVA